ncbi:PPOX class F420-dependent oxidoreductase [Mycobacterium sp. SMC-8]|uniref:PPOX class F420-dependent oxidoreductase n=1 Tax=Mycobacterium sp. SMC-8 TaxID=2857060 RepID=UPI0021B19389|nr:PPOX class F420-dependent oxidoreductase [Mycobacterium sp. SMC-8]
MTDEEYRRFLGAGTRTAKVATTRGDGRPHVVPVWFLLDHDDLVFTTGKTSVKGRSVLRSGHVAVCVDDERPPYAFVAVDGRTTTNDDPEELLSWTTRIAARYVGQERAEYYGKFKRGTRSDGGAGQADAGCVREQRHG